MRQLLPLPKDSGDVSDEDLLQLYDDTPTDGAFVRLNLVSTLDGAGVGPDGLTGSINTPADHVVFALLRAWADVIVVGSATARAEGYQPAVTDDRWRELRLGRPADPAIAVVSGRGVLPSGMHPQSTGGEVILVTGASADAGAVQSSRDLVGANNVVQQRSSNVDFAAVVRSLADRALPRVLCEGGPMLASSWVQAELVDELCLTWSPLLVGGTSTRVLHTQQLTTQATLRSLLHQDGTLIGRWQLRG